MIRREWRFNTKEEATDKLEKLKHQETYEIVQNRIHGRFITGWVLRTRT